MGLTAFVTAAARFRAPIVANNGLAAMNLTNDRRLLKLMLVSITIAKFLFSVSYRFLSEVSIINTQHSRSPSRDLSLVTPPAKWCCAQEKPFPIFGFYIPHSSGHNF